MKTKYNLVQIVEAWLDKKVSTEEMQKFYKELPKFKPEPWEYGDDEDPTMFNDGNRNSLMEVQAILVGERMTIEEFLELRELIKKKD